MTYIRQIFRPYSILHITYVYFKVSSPECASETFNPEHTGSPPHTTYPPLSQHLPTSPECRASHQINMDRLREVELVDDLAELSDDLVVPGHVGGQDAADDALARAPLLVGAEARQHVGGRLAEDGERHRAVVVLQRRHVVVAQRQVGAGVYLRTAGGSVRKSKRRREKEKEERKQKRRTGRKLNVA